MSDARINKLHRDLAALQGESARQRQHQQQITNATHKMLESVNQQLHNLVPADKPDEYEHLLTEKGILEQTLESAKR